MWGLAGSSESQAGDVKVEIVIQRFKIPSQMFAANLCGIATSLDPPKPWPKK